ncbi:bifunctional 2-polyprenyl-6-hydroxyphenol methylase/3-demethylubiquinol 3-O-methyltransferase UbiG [Sporolactobacillus sp. THM19-2]|jgi:SAM-dependent methyltransferase|uniref:class I SAM-dependent methyltransferase n=1 Tax=Sporolactobacillus sp. THM19-2 TaxID=2511171 RepID=UPI00102161B7|nr:class I SAM-dependent methyltransferase [Sporolactobacillus sp. THM19-2]RYL86386.1 class I SAM-dependent methyltransferase [Sporolactobacillus sp. THM19-2]
MQSQKEYWNKVASDKRFTTPFRLDLFSRYVAKDDRILDYGCGYGRTLSELSSRHFTHLYGVDFSEEMIQRARFNESDEMKLSVVNLTRLKSCASGNIAHLPNVQAEVTTLLPRLVPSRRIFFAALISLS